MERGHLPYCEDCIVPLSVQHVLAECPSREEERRRFSPNTLDLSVEERMSIILAEPTSGSFDINKLVLFLQSCNAIHKI